MSNVQALTVRLMPGQELKSALEELVKNRDLKSAFVITCVGSLTRATLRLATPADSGLASGEAVVTYGNENFEICSLVGTLSHQGSHLHAVLSRADGTTVGGHVVGDMVLQTTAEVVIGNIPGEIYSREHDASTGYKELVVSVQGLQSI